MKLLFYIGHPAHYHNFRLVSEKLAAKGISIIYLIRPKDVVLDLVKDLPGEKVILPTKSGSSKFHLVFDVFMRSLRLFQLVRKHKVRLLVGTDPAITHLGRFTGVPSIVVNEDDADAVPLFAKSAYPFATKILVPEGCRVGNHEAKTIRYKGNHELAYLHPNHWKPNFELVKDFVEGPRKYIVMRFSALNAHHDTGVQGITDEFALKLIQAAKGYQVIITSERPLSADLEKYRKSIPPRDIHHLLAFAKVFIGDSQTMAAESMVLGTPSIRCNDFVGRLTYLEDLEHKFQLGYGVLPANRSEMIGLLGKLLNDEGLEEDWQKKRQQMLAVQIDVAEYWTELFAEMITK